ncbi:restriction endonuclease subunit S [Paenimyroides ceti]
MSYKRLGDYIVEKVEFNEGNKYDLLQGVSNNKYFQKAKTNTIGVDLSKYRVTHYNQFVFNRATTRNGDKISIALRKGESCIVSPSYRIFEVKDENILHPDYLLMWFKRPEFDRYARFKSHGSAHEFFDMNEMNDVELPIPSIEKQREIVAQYQAVENKIKVNEQICEKLEATAQALYKHWFVDFEFPNENGQPYKSSGGNMVWNEELGKEIPEDWEVKSLSDISKITMGQSPEGENYNEIGQGKIFYQGRTEFGFRIPDVRIFTTLSKKNAKKGDILMSVRAPVGDLNIADSDCSIGRGIAALSSKESSYLFYLMKGFNSYFEQSDGTGTIFSSINKDELFNLKVIYNEDYSKYFHEKMKHIDYEIILISKQNQKLTQLQSLLLSRLATLEG